MSIIDARRDRVYSGLYRKGEIVEKRMCGIRHELLDCIGKRRCLLWWGWYQKYGDLIRKKSDIQPESTLCDELGLDICTNFVVADEKISYGTAIIYRAFMKGLGKLKIRYNRCKLLKHTWHKENWKKIKILEKDLWILNKLQNKVISITGGRYDQIRGI